MRALVNVGMDKAHGGHLGAQDVLDALTAHGMEVRYWAVPDVDKEVEATFIGYVDYAASSELAQVAWELDQEAIAVYDMDNANGILVGPKASAWAPFRREAFKVL